jgi:DTW domain-containing protein
VNLETYQARRKAEKESAWTPRPVCENCRTPVSHCYCEGVTPFASDPRIVVLSSQGEARRTVATGRMVHQVLSNSLLFEGLDFSAHAGVNEVLAHAKDGACLLYPGRNSVNLSDLTLQERKARFPSGGNLTVFVLDGTWAEAKRMYRLSPNLKALPQICFTPSRRSLFLVRKQPASFCFSTVEAVNELFHLLYETPDPRTKGLLTAFYALNRKQLACELRAKRGRKTASNRRGRS